MKIIHCADMHLDSKMETNLTTEQAKERRYELLATFEKMVSIAVAQQVTVIMIAGDMFDTVHSSQKRLKARVLDIIKSNSQIDFLYLQGNHDHDNYFKSLEEKPCNLKFFGSEWVEYVYGNVVISGIELGKDSDRRVYHELILNENNVNIVMMHGQVVSGGLQTQGDEIVLSELQDKYIDYLALGHVHKYYTERLDYRGEYGYSGCLEGRGYDECGEKGFILLDVEDNKITHSFHGIAKRMIHEVEVDVTSVQEHQLIMDSVQEAIDEIPSKDYVKVVLVGQLEEEMDIDIKYLEQKLDGQFYTYKLEDKTETKIDYMKYEYDISLKGEFIRSVLAMDLSEQDKSKVIRMGIHALKGKEIL